MSSNPRVHLNLPPDLHQALKEKSKAIGISQAEIIRRLVRYDLKNKTLKKGGK